MTNKRLTSEPYTLSRRGRLCLVCISLLLASAIAASSAVAAAPKLVTSFPEGGTLGSGAGEFQLSTAIATDPVNGHVYVAEDTNARISEFTAWGAFVKAWGWGVVASGPDDKPHNEIQKVSLDPGVGSGSFKLVYRETRSDSADSNGRQQETAPITFNASASAVEEALIGLGSIAPGDVVVNGPSGGPWTVEFVGRYQDMDIAPLEVTSSLVGGEAHVQTMQGGASFEVCDPSVGDVCRKGQAAGSSPGEIVRPHGIAFNSSGDLYVYEGELQELEAVKGLRVQEFSADGRFLTMFGGEVDKTTKANVCSATSVEAGDECGAGITGSTDAHFLDSGESGNGGNVAVGVDGTVYVGDKNRIQEFDSSGVYKSSIPLPSSGEVMALTFDTASGALYMAFAQEFLSNFQPKGPYIYKLDPTDGKVLAEIQVGLVQALASDQIGDLYAIAQSTYGDGAHIQEVIEFDPEGRPIIPLTEGFDQSTGSFTFERPGMTVDSACGTTAVYVIDDGSSFTSTYKSVDMYGSRPDPGLCPPPLRAPAVLDQYATSVGGDRAVVRASINPYFWEDTAYYVQYGTSDCKLGGCAEEPLSPGLTLPEAGVSAPLRTVGVTLSGLRPDTTYHYRFVAKSSGGGPVYGVGPAEEGAMFTTRTPAPAPDIGCPNESSRLAASANLPDCRAYEMVSPADKAGGNVVARGVGTPYEQSVYQAALDGSRFTYSSYRSFGGAQSGAYSTQYMASRDQGAGWTSTSISPPNGVNFGGIKAAVKNEFDLFSADLCTGWLTRTTNPPLAVTAPESFADIYARADCGGEPDYRPLIEGGSFAQSELEASASTKVVPPELQGVSTDGKVAVVRVNAKLTEDASSAPQIEQLYEDREGALRLLSVLPDGKRSETSSSLGPTTGLGLNRTFTVAGAISSDGSVIYWTKLPTATSGGECGEVFVRVDGEETRQVSGGSEESCFWTAAHDGSVALFSVGESLYEYQLETGAKTLIAGKVSGVMGASADASLVYFISSEALASGASAGGQNLYLEDHGSVRFVAPMASSDAVSREVDSPVSFEPYRHLARVSVDGRHAAFVSSSKTLSEQTAGYDNTDAQTGEPDAEVYVYDADTEALRCVSCDPADARPDGRMISSSEKYTVRAAAQIPGWSSELYASRVMSEDGNRVFFDSYVPLVAADKNDSEDVYEWERPGTGDCTEASGAFVASAGGCVSLISSGESPHDSEFLDASSEGADVFFLTEASLSPADSGQLDVYDARVDGGVAPVPVGAGECSGETCQPSVPVLIEAIPGSVSFFGVGNQTVKPLPKRVASKRKSSRKRKPACQKKARGKPKRKSAHGCAGSTTRRGRASAKHNHGDIHKRSGR